MPVMITLVDGTIPVAADFNTNFTNLNSAIGASTAITTYTTGDIVYASAANTLSKLAIGGTAQVLAVSGGIPAWANAGTTVPLTGLGLSNGTDATNDIDIAVGACLSEDAAIADRVSMSLTSILVKQLDAVWAVGTNAGMRATGLAIANTTYHIFLIKRPDTGVVDVAADTSATGANIAANTDAAYTKIRRIGAIVRASGTILAFTQRQNVFELTTPILDVDITNPGTSAVTRTLTVPSGIVVDALMNVYIERSTNAFMLYLSPLTATDSAPSATVAPLATLGAAVASGSSGQVRVFTNTSAQIRSRFSLSGGGDALRIVTRGWIDQRGQG